MDEFWKYGINWNQTTILEEHNATLLLTSIFQIQEI